MIYKTIGIIGLIAIILGVILSPNKKLINKKYYYFFFILGGIALAIYSISINDTIFIILQTVFTISSIYGLIKINENKRKTKK